MGAPPRSLRADAARNHERLLAVARAAVLAGEAQIALDEIARRAEVGIGTLYRHFPTRGALLEALYREEVDGLCDRAETLAAGHPPAEALHAWLLAFVDVLVAKRMLASALEASEPDRARPAQSSGDRLKAAVRRLAQAAADDGAFDPAVEPVDLLRALSGVASVAPDAQTVARARAMVGLLLAGARPAPSAAG